MDAHLVLLGELDGAGVEHLGAGRGHFQHLFVAERVDLAGVGRNRGLAVKTPSTSFSGTRRVGFEAAASATAVQVGTAGAGW